MQTEPFYTEEAKAILQTLGQDSQRAEAALECLLSEPPKQAEVAIWEELCRVESLLKVIINELSALAERLPKRKSVFEEYDGDRFYAEVGGAVARIDRLLIEGRESRREEIARVVRDTRLEILKNRYFCEVVSRAFPTLTQKACRGVEQTRAQEDALERLASRFGEIQVQYADFFVRYATPFLTRVGKLADVKHRGERLQGGAVREACEMLCEVAENLIVNIKAED